ncbi:MAG TPA: hypothetical protein VGN32_03800 [Ktedonobacterales bacterium]|jgi:hypothetical protein|nr:hypothetical protein [Ktedonobacterales bacterium]
MKVLAFVLKTTDRLVARILLTALFCGVLALVVTLLVAYEGTRQWPPQQLTYVAMAIIAGFAAYAGGVSVLLSGAVHSLVRAHALAEAAQPGAQTVNSNAAGQTPAALTPTVSTP